MSPLLDAFMQIAAFVITVASFAFGWVIGVDTGRRRERDRIRDRIVTDQATCAADYTAAEEYADRMVRP